MRCSFRWLMKIASFVLVLCATIHRPANSQEAESGRRPVRNNRPPTFLVPPGLEENQQAAEPQRRGETTVDERLSGEPTESIAFTLWIVKVGEPPQPAADELSAKLAERVADLPPVVGSVKDVHHLVGQLKVAGLAQSVREFRLVSHNGQSASVQNGKNHPRIVATVISPEGRTNTIQYEPLGTVIKIKPRIDADLKIQVNVEITDSDLEKSTEVVLTESADGSPTFADVMTTRQFHTTTSVKNNSAVLLHSASSSGASGDTGAKTELIILGAAVLPLIE